MSENGIGRTDMRGGYHIGQPSTSGTDVHVAEVEECAELLTCQSAGKIMRLYSEMHQETST